MHSSSFGRGLPGTAGEDYQTSSQNRDSQSDLLPDRNTYSTFGGLQTQTFSQKPRSPFTTQHLNEQQQPPSYSRGVETGY